MNLYKLQNSTLNATSNVNISSKAKFFSLSKILNKLIHHTKNTGKHIHKHHKKYIGFSGSAIVAHLLIFKLAAIKIIGIKLIIIILTSLGSYSGGLEHIVSANHNTGQINSGIISNSIVTGELLMGDYISSGLNFIGDGNIVDTGNILSGEAQRINNITGENITGNDIIGDNIIGNISSGDVLEIDNTTMNDTTGNNISGDNIIGNITTGDIANNNTLIEKNISTGTISSSIILDTNNITGSTQIDINTGFIPRGRIHDGNIINGNNRNNNLITDISTGFNFSGNQNVGENIEIIQKDIKTVLQDQGFMKTNGKWRGKQNLDLRQVKGKIKTLEPIIIKGDNAEFELPNEIFIKNKRGEYYTGTIQKPKELSVNIAKRIEQNKKIKINKVIKIGSDQETIKFKDINNEPKPVKVTIKTQTGNIGDKLAVYFSQDEIIRQYLTSSYITQVNGNKVVEFYTTHFTTFALGGVPGEFTINNDDTYTTGLDVVLNISGTNISQMRFGNTITERNNASRETYSSTKNRTLTGTGNGQHTVYAEFSGGGSTVTVEDNIILNQNKLLSQGSIDIQGMNWQTVVFNKEYVSTPVVLATPQTDNNTNNYPIPTIRNITTTGFQIAICVDEGNPTCGTGSQETLGYFVFDIDWANEYDWIEVGTSSIATNGSTTTLSLSSNFANAPILRTTPQTYNQNGNIAAVAWVNDNQTTSSANLIGCVQQGTADACTSGQPAETIGYAAIDTSNVDTAIIQTYQNGMKDISSSTWTNISFSPNYIQPLVMVTQNDDDGGQDPQYPWARGISPESADIRYCEQDGPQDCDSHTSEKTYWFATEGYDMTTLPTASVEYDPAYITGQTTPYNVIATLTGFNKDLITITNNGGSDQYTFTSNGSFVFEFVDAAGNTGQTTATVTWIDKSRPVVMSTIPTSGENATLPSQDIIIEFTKSMDTGSVESNISISPNNNGWTYLWNGNNDTVTISHNNFAFNTNYTITITTGAKDDNNAELLEPYIFNFKTIQNLPLIVAGQIKNLTGLTWNHVNLKYNYDSPPIILSTPITDNGENNYPIPTIKNVTTSGFDIAICVDAGLATCSTSNTGEDLDYFVFNSDISKTIDWIQVGTKQIKTDGSTTALSLSSNFANAPILRTTPQTYNQNGNIAAIAWINDNQTTSSADLIGCVHQGTANTCTSGQPDEQLGYVAIDINNVNIDSWQNGMQDISNSTWTPVSFSPNYIWPRIMVTQNDDDGGQDTQYPRARNISTGSADIRYCEADGANYCDTHASEKTYWFTIEGYDMITLPTADIIYNPQNLGGGYKTSGDVITTLTGFNKSGINITNNGGSNIYTFTNNGSFTFEFEDLAGNTGESTATINRIDKTKPTATIEYSPISGNITSGNVIATLTGFSESNITITNNNGSGIYIFTGNGIFIFKFKDIAGNTGESTATVNRIDKTIPTIINTTPISGDNNVAINQNIILYFNTNMDHNSVESNLAISPSLNSTGFIRSGNNTLIISHNNFNFNTNYNLILNTGAKNYLNTHLENQFNLNFYTRGEVNIIYNNNLFNESFNNDGSIKSGDKIIITLTGDTFSSGIINNNNIITENIPTGLSTIFTRDSDTQITMTLTGNATNHNDENDINNISLSFTDDAFTSYNSGEVPNSIKTDIEIDFLDPYQQLQIIPTHDNLLDADTASANGCDNGSCQEANYGDLDYGGCSDFGSTQIMRFDLSNIGSGSKIYSATFRMTKMNLDIGTGFEIKQIINNHGWIEGVGNQAGSNAEKALTGESNFKQRKRTQENWNNGGPGLIQEDDYKTSNIIINPQFDTQGDETKTFELNSTGVSMIQERIDDESKNDGFALMNSNTDRLIIRTSEYASASERPLLTINYIPDKTRPTLINKTPTDNAIDISTTTNLSMEFDERIFANTGYNIYIKKYIDDTTIETIPANSNNINIDNNTMTVVINPIDFDSNTSYYILIDSGAFQDISANTFTGISNKDFWNFTTINTDNIPKLTGYYYSDLTSTSATMGGVITSVGSGNIIERGIYRSLVNGFSDGAGTKISNLGNRTNTGLFILPVNGFSSGTHIYFKAFAVNNYGTGYSPIQGEFITKPNIPTINITDTSNKSFRVNRDNITGADSYTLYIATDINFGNYATGYNPMTGITNTTYLANGLDVETNYFVKVVAINDGGNSPDSNIINTTTTFTPTPTVHLKFEESAGAVAYDSVSNHDGILEGDPTKLQSGAADNYAYNFDGIDDALSIVDFDYGPELSIYFWIKQTSAGDNKFVFSHGAETDPNSINIYFNDSNQKLITSINGNTSAIAITGADYTGLLDNQRHLYVLTLDYATVTGKIQSKIYIDGSLTVEDSSINATTNYNPNTNIVLGRRGTNTAGTYYNGYIDDFRMYNQYLLESEVNQLYLSTLDDIPPAATVTYSPGSGEQTTSNVIATLTGYSESGVIITNNLGQDTYTFTENGSFAFEFKDAAGNTGETTATVTRIVTGTLDILVPTAFTFSGSIKSRNYDQILTGQYTGDNYFSINDQLGLDRGRYTTISATDLTGNNYSDNITNDNLFIKANGIQKLSGDTNTGVEINSVLLNNYTPLSGQVNYIFRNTASNDLKKGKYGDQPYLKINFPAFKPADNYHGQIIFTLYEN